MAIVFTDMQLTDDESNTLCMPCDPEPNKKLLPRYPYGLCISLTEKELEKLGLDPKAAVSGGMVHLHAIARITATSNNTTQDGKEHHRIELQIEQMAVESEDEENEQAELAMSRGAKMAKLYAGGGDDDSED